MEGARVEQGSPGRAFVSYSRADRAFVDRLDDALTKSGHAPWIDRRDIEPSVEFQEAIFEAIDVCDGFIVVLSETWLRSEFCQLELDHALASEKRVFVLELACSNRAEVRAEIRRLQWLSFRAGEDWEAGFDRLRMALDTDASRIRAHTRLLLRAREWRAAENPRLAASRLLRGRELQAAEEFVLGAAPERKPRIIDLQRRFVDASRRAARGRMAKQSVVALVALGGLVGAWLWGRHQEAVALSRQVAAAATTALRSGQLVVPRVLAAEAWSRAPTFEAEQALVQVQRGCPGLRSVLLEEDEELQGVSLDISRDGGRIAVARGIQALVFDARTGRPVGAPLDLAAGGNAAVALDARGTRLAAASGAFVRIRDLATTAEDRSFEAHSGPIVRLAFVDRTGQLLTLGEDRFIRLWDLDVEPPARLAQAMLSTAPGLIAIDRGGTQAVSLDDGGWLTALSIPELTLRTTRIESPGPAWTAIDVQEQRVALGAADGTIRILQGPDWTVVEEWRASGEIERVSLLADGAGVATAAKEGLELWTLGGSRLRPALRDAQREFGYASVAVDPTGAILVSASSGGPVLVWNLRDDDVECALGPQLDSPAAGLAWLDAGRAVACVDTAGTLFVGTADRASFRERAHAEGACGIRALPNSTEFLTAGRSPALVLWSLERTGPVRLSDFGLSDLELTQFAVAPRGDGLAFVVNSTTLVVHRREGRELSLVGRKDLALRRAMDLEFDPLGRWLAVACSDGSVQLFAPGAPGLGASHVLGGYGGQRNRVAFDPRGRWMATAGAYSTVTLWSLGASGPTRRVEIDCPFGTICDDLTFSADGEHLLASFERVGLALIEVQTGRCMSHPLGGSGGRMALADGQGAVLVTTDGWPTRLSLSPDAWAAAALRAANRNLSPEEWDLHVGTAVAYRRTRPSWPVGVSPRRSFD